MYAYTYLFTCISELLHMLCVNTCSQLKGPHWIHLEEHHLLVHPEGQLVSQSV